MMRVFTANLLGCQWIIIVFIYKITVTYLCELYEAFVIYVSVRN